ncbi:WDR73 protein, partial [Amia calva]|nr:WDR73 protein [Amia calva]
QGLCPERDFKVEHGGFSDTPIHCLKHVLGTRSVVTSGPPESPLQIWRIGGDDSDVIKRTACIEASTGSRSQRKVAPSLSGKPCVLHASQVNDTALTDLESHRSLYSVDTDCADRVSGLEFVSADEFVVCSDRGHLWLCDVRDPAGLQSVASPEQEGLQWCMGLKKRHVHTDPAACAVARLSSACQVLVTDLRSPRSPLCQAKMTIHQDAPCLDYMTVTWAPALDQCVAVSGFNGAVHIYDTQSWGPAATEAEPLFIHKGHRMSHDPDRDRDSVVVTTHVWHPWKPRTVLSAATNGSLHVWDWADQ